MSNKNKTKISKGKGATATNPSMLAGPLVAELKFRVKYSLWMDGWVDGCSWED